MIDLIIQFRKLYQALPFFGALPFCVKKDYRFLHSTIYYCKTYKYSTFKRIFLFPVAYLVWLLKALIGISVVYKRSARRVKEESGLSLSKQLMHLLYLAYCLNTEPHYYYRLKLYERSLKIGETFFTNRQLGPILGFLSRDLSRERIQNKLEFWKEMNSNGIKTVEIIGHTSSGFITFFNEHKVLPTMDLFIKPNDGYGGRNCISVDYIGTPEYKVFPSEMIFDKKNLHRYLVETSGDNTMIIQPRLKNHASLDALSNGNLATCRITTFLDQDSAVHFLFGLFMMPVDDSLTSNTNGIGAAVSLSSGNLLAAISLGNPLFPVDIHPQGNGEITGFQLPGWEIAKSICEKAHKNFSKLPIIGWDIAFTDDGPILIEGNLVWDVEYWQLANNTNSHIVLTFAKLLERYLKK